MYFASIIALISKYSFFISAFFILGIMSDLQEYIWCYLDKNIKKTLMVEFLN